MMLVEMWFVDKLVAGRFRMKKRFVCLRWVSDSRF